MRKSEKEKSHRELKKFLKEISGRQHEPTKKDDHFVMWFLVAHWGADEEHAAKAITGGSRDKGIDALLIDDATKTVCIVQGKPREQPGVYGESEEEINKLIVPALKLTASDDSDFAQYLKSANAIVANKLKVARSKVMNHEYGINLYYVTLGSVSDRIRSKAKELEQGIDNKHRCRYTIFDSEDCLKLSDSYLEGGPPVAFVELEISDTKGVPVSSMLRRHDADAGIETMVFTMRGDKVAALYHAHGRRLFAANIRGFLGIGTSSRVNQGIEKTIHHDPDNFFYYNNGITILCESALQPNSSKLHLTRAEIINGQQTTRTLAEQMDSQIAKVSVLVKVICVTEKKDGRPRITELRSQIVTGTNRQNAIRPSDLMANDSRQILLERKLKRLRYWYIRKRQTKVEVRKQLDSKGYILIQKAEFAQAVAACGDDPKSPSKARTSKEKLFELEEYKKCFPSEEPSFYLTRYWLMQMVRGSVYGEEQRKQEPKWMVLHFVWHKLQRHLTGLRGVRFCDLCRQRDDEFIKPLRGAIRYVFTVGAKFYNTHKDDGPKQVDIETFYKNEKSAHAGRFAEFFKSCDREAQAFDKYFNKAVSVLKSE